MGNEVFRTKISGIDGVLATLQKLPKEVAGKNGGPVKLSLAKGARLVRDKARANWRRSVEAPGKSGVTVTTGFTEKVIVNRRGKMQGGMKGERQVVTVRYAQLHPRGGEFRGHPTYANDVAFVMEYGSATQPAQPWLRTAYADTAHQAIDVITTDLVGRVDKLATKLGIQNQAKG